MRHLSWWAIALLLVPGQVLAADGDVLDLQHGFVSELTVKTLGLAHGLLAFLLLLGLVLEMLRGPGQQKHYLAVVWRTLLVLGLLQAYTFVASSVVKQCTALAHILAREDANGASLEPYRSAVAQSFAESGGKAPPTSEDEGGSTGIGGFLFQAAVLLLQVVAQAIYWGFTQLSRILIAFFYAIGPLALVFYVPGLDAPARWLRSLVTVACWPLVSALLLNLSISVLDHSRLPTTGAGAAFSAVASSLLLCLLAFATPKIASALIGGVGNLIGEGAATALSVATRMAAAGVRP